MKKSHWSLYSVLCFSCRFDFNNPAKNTLAVKSVFSELCGLSRAVWPLFLEGTHGRWVQFSALWTPNLKKINNTPATVVVKFSAHNIRATCMFTQNSGWLVFIKLVSINNSMVWTLKTHTIISVLSVVNLLGDPVHVCNLFLVADDLDGRPHILDHLGVRLPLLHHTWHDFLIHHNCGKTR